MSSSDRKARPASARVSTSVITAVVAVVSALSLLTFESDALAAGVRTTTALSKTDESCLYCHKFETLSKELQNGEELSLHVARDVFAKSAHARLGCTACHADVELANHPVRKTIGDPREYTVRASKVCSRCHVGSGLGSKHHQRVSNGAGPACAECHEPHAITTVAEWKVQADDTTYCLSCHGQAISVSPRDGEPRTLSIDENQLRESVHLDHQCTDCHAGYSKQEHGSAEFASARELSISLATTCRECHEDKYQQYQGSIHAALVEEGDLAAPVCTDCHGSHSIAPKSAYDTITGVPCKQCHENVFNAYLASTHGQAWSERGHIEAPVCADCHRAHDVGVASMEERLTGACLGCHPEMVAVHQVWLPNTELHFEAVSCPACHAPTAQRKVDLKLYDGVAQTPLSDEGLSAFEYRARSADTEGNGLDAMELWNLVRQMNQEGSVTDITLRGRMEVQTGIEAHQLAGKTEAIRDCGHCHRDGADPFQSVTISIVRPDGRPLRYDADSEILNSAVSVDSLPGFYAIGGTRIKLLDVLLLIAVLIGVSVPIFHMATRRYFRKKQLAGDQ